MVFGGGVDYGTLMIALRLGSREAMPDLYHEMRRFLGVALLGYVG